jgi:hypothetical protein
MDGPVFQHRQDEVRLPLSRLIAAVYKWCHKSRFLKGKLPPLGPIEAVLQADGTANCGTRTTTEDRPEIGLPASAND